MPRYKLIEYPDRVGEDGREVINQRKSTKAEVDQWIDDNIRAAGLDRRVGYLIKFRNSSHKYEWVWIKNNQPVKV